MKNPNGVGSICKLPGKRRKPYAIRVTVGWETRPDGSVLQKKKYVGYYATRKEALEAISADIMPVHDMTLFELYEKWSREHFEKVKPTTAYTIERTFSHFSPFYRKRLSTIALKDYQALFDKSGTNKPTQLAMKSVLSSLLKYAKRNDIKMEDRISLIQVTKENPNAIPREVFTPEEIDKLWEDGSEKAGIVLLLIYTGLRIGELFNLKKEDVDLDRQCLNVRASKTAAGIREVPIADKVLPFARHWMEKPGKFFLTNKTGGQMYREIYGESYWRPVMRKIGANHRPHDTRHTFISLMVQKEIDERIIKKIVGHASNNVTDSVYTHISLEKKLEAVNRL